MLQLGIAPKIIDIENRAPSVDAWFAAVRERLTAIGFSGAPTGSDVPMGQYGIFKNTATGEVALWVNDGGIYKKVTFGHGAAFKTPQDYGAYGDGSTDDTAAFQRFAAAEAGWKFIPAGTYNLNSLTSTLEFQPNDFVTGAGAASVLDASSCGIAAGNPIIRIQSPLTNLGNTMLTAAISAGTRSFTVASTTYIADGDVLIIYDSSNYSWSTHRPEYRKGEFVHVGDTSGTTVYPLQMFYDSYTTGCYVYKMSGASAHFSNFKIKTPPTATVGWEIDGCKDVTVDNVIVSGNNSYAGGDFKRCYGVNLMGPTYQSTPSVDDEYGVGIYNCQAGTIRLTEGVGGRHPIAFGGGDWDACVPNRNFTVYGGVFGNLGPASSGNLHGNCEDIKYVGTTFNNGVDVSGANNQWIGCWMRGNQNSGIAVYGAELVKGTHHFVGCKIQTYVNPNSGGFGVIHLGNITSNVNGVLTFQFDDCIYDAPNSTTYFLVVDITSGTVAPDIIVNGGHNRASGLTQFIRLQRSGGAATINDVHLMDLSGLPSGCYYAYNAGAGLTVTRYRLPIQSGSTSVPVSGTGSAFSSNTTLRHPYPTAPRVVASGTYHTIGGKRIWVGGEATTTTMSCIVATADGTTFSSADTAVVHWFAKVSD